MRCALLLVLLAGYAGIATATPEIPSFEAGYRIERSVFDVGRIRLKFRIFSDGSYAYDSLTEVAGFMAWFSDDRVVESSHGHLDADAIHPNLYRFERIGGKRNRRIEVRFDHAAGTVTNQVDGDPWIMQIPRGTLDKLVVQIAMMRNLQGRLEEQHFRVADGGRLKDFRITLLGDESLETPAGQFDTVKVEKGPEPDGRQTFLWLAPALGYLPVQIMRIENDGATYISRLEYASDSLRAE